MSALAERLQARIDDLEDQNRVLREALAAECAPLAPLGLSGRQDVVMAALMRSDRVSYDALASAWEASGGRELMYARSDSKVVSYHMRRRLARHGIEITTHYGVGYSLSPAAKARVREVCARGGAA